MTLPVNKTKIVCTIGPASESVDTLERMIRAGMNVARLNFSHGDFESHSRVIDNLRRAADAAGRRVAVMADLPGPKMRIGRLAEEPIELEQGNRFTLTTNDIVGDNQRVSVTFGELPKVVKAGDRLFINDGIVQLEVMRTEGSEVHCRVQSGGELRSRKGLNLPGIDLGVSAFTDRDRECLAFAMGQGVDIVSQSFVEKASDIQAVRESAKEMGRSPFVVAKIERACALENLDEILEAADGIMVARGDLGVEIPIQEIALVQKRLMEKANWLGKPIITATQMLESMIYSRRPTRAEATDVANAVLDGADAVMLSGESAVGNYPVYSVQMLADIAASIEPHRSRYRLNEALRTYGRGARLSLPDLISLAVETTLERVVPATVMVPTFSGATARLVARFRFPVWITAVSPQKSTCQELQLTYGVCPVHEHVHPTDWNQFAANWVLAQGLKGDLVVLTEGPSPEHPEGNHRMELIELKKSQNTGYRSQ
jgi:pyruvate kinase